MRDRRRTVRPSDVPRARRGHPGDPLHRLGSTNAPPTATRARRPSDCSGFTPEEWGPTPTCGCASSIPTTATRAGRERPVERSTASRSRPSTASGEGRAHRVAPRRGAARRATSTASPRYWRGFMHDITAQKQAEEKLRWSLEVLRRTIQQRRELAQRLESAQEEERRRIAADIHDDPIQVMSAVDLRLQMLARASRSDHDAGDRRAAGARCASRSSGCARWCSSSVRRRSTVTGSWPRSTQYLRTRPRRRGGRTSAATSSTAEPPTDLRAIALPHRAGGGRQRPQARRRLAHVSVRVTTAATASPCSIPDDGTGLRHRPACDDPGARSSGPGHDGGAGRARGRVVPRVERPDAGTTVECWLLGHLAGWLLNALNRSSSWEPRCAQVHPGEHAAVEHAEVVGLVPHGSRPEPIGSGGQRAEVGHRRVDERRARV